MASEVWGRRPTVFRGQTTTAMSGITHILGAIDQGDASAARDLLPLVYEELRKLAASKMAHEAPGHTLQPTALVHEAWLKLVGEEEHIWKNRAHFFAAAAEAMRRILVDRARRTHRVRHGGGQQRLNVDDVELAGLVSDDTILEVHEALDRFAKEDVDKAELVKLRYFGGLSFNEAASVLGISEPTAKRWWAYSRAWLLTEIKEMRT